MAFVGVLAGLMTLAMVTEDDFRVQVGNASESSPKLTGMFQLSNVLPLGDVSIPIHVTEPGEVRLTTVSPIVIPLEQWNVSQTFDIEVLNDYYADGDRPFTITIGPISDPGGPYNGYTTKLTRFNLDDDVVELRFSPSSLKTSENDTEPHNTSVTLGAKPRQPVTFSVSSDNEGEGTIVGPVSKKFTFTPDNWNISQSLLIKAMDDDFDDDGDQTYHIISSATDTTDVQYKLITEATAITVVNENVHVSGVSIKPGTCVLAVWEDGNTNKEPVSADTRFLELVLTSKPRADVTIPLKTNDDTEVIFAQDSVLFTPANWNKPQKIEVLPGKDADETSPDCDQAVSIVVEDAKSADPKYNDKHSEPLTVLNLDDDGICLHTYPACVQTQEANIKPASVMMWFSNPQKPTQDITVSITTSDTTESSVDPTSLTFTPDDYLFIKTFTVNGVDDDFADPDEEYTVDYAVASGDAAYAKAFKIQTAGTNFNDETAGIILKETASITENPANGGNKATFTIQFTSRPYHPVSLHVNLVDSTGAIATPEPKFTFGPVDFPNLDPLKWKDILTFTAQTEDNLIADASMEYKFTLTYTSVDPAYDKVTDMSATTQVGISVINDDIASVKFVMTPDVFEPVFHEGQFDTTTWDVVLTSEPLADVIVFYNGVDQTFQSERIFAREMKIEPDFLTFTPTNWNVPQVFKITGQDDNIDEEDSSFTRLIFLSNSTDPAYHFNDTASGVQGYHEVWLDTRDDDTSSMNASSLNAADENGGYADVVVNLGSEPLCNWSSEFQLSPTDGMIVTARVLPTDPAAARVRIEPETFSVPRTEWNQSVKTFRVYAVDNLVSDGDVNVTVELTITDACYHYGTYFDTAYTGMVATTTVLVKDNDYPGLNYTSTELRTVETGTLTLLTVNLNTKPTANVAVELTGVDATEGKLSTTTLTFTPDDWNLVQTVNVTGVDDSEMDGDITYQITLTATSADTDYNTLSPGQVVVINEDDDIPGLMWTINGGEKNETVVTSEDKNIVTLDVSLTTKPNADVTLNNFVVSDATEAAIVDPTTSMTFTPDNWNIPQPLGVQGVDDDEKDQDQQYEITYTVVTTDANYSVWGATPPAIPGVNDDNDIPGVVVAPLSGHTSESGDVFHFSLRLRTLPSSDVTLRFASSNVKEGVVNASGMAHFTTTNWMDLQYIEVTGVNDDILDGDIPYEIRFTNPDTNDPDYKTIAVPPITIINKDNEVSKCAVFGGVCTNAACTACCASACGVCGAPGCNGTASRDEACCDDDIRITDKPCTLATPAPCIVVDPPNPVPCKEYVGICKDTTCAVCCSAGCGLCGGPTCSDSGHSDKCCEPDIFTSNQTCVEKGSAPCIRVRLCQDITCDGETSCRAAGVCDEHTGKCIYTPKPDGEICETTNVCQNGVCAKTTPTCDGVKCPGVTSLCVDAVCDAGTGKCAETAKPEAAGATCNDNNAMTNPDTCVAQAAPATGATCVGTSKCDALGGVCSTGNCDVCCDKSCGDMCGGPSCVGNCCVDPIVDSGAKCDAAANVVAPCVRVTTDCLKYGGVCSDAQCTYCCQASCGDKCGATDCATAVGGSDACCQDPIVAKNKVCSAYTFAPCVRYTKCDEFGGLCADEACAVCCSPECPVCATTSTECSKLPALLQASCCATTIPTTGAICNAGTPAPCVRPIIPDRCTAFGGICTDITCTACCPMSCGATCGSVGCTGNCCHEPIVTTGTKCSVFPTVSAPCIVDNVCEPFGGACSGTTCQMCCDPNKCSACGGDAGCKPSTPECCESPSTGVLHPQCGPGVAAPCTRLDPCTQFSGVCQSPDCVVCCNNGDCTHGDKICTDTQAAPCIRVSKCAEFGGICKDPECTACCDASCGVCGGQKCLDSATDGQCCDDAIRKVNAPCSLTKGAPCTRVTTCSQYGGICQDEACEVCCSKECGTCGDTVVANPPAGVECPTVTDILKKPYPHCSSTTNAPCIRNGACAQYGGKCEDMECLVCCSAECDRCGGDICHFDSQDKCCPTSIHNKGSQCTGEVHAPCVRVHECSEFGGICNSAECTLCCDQGCQQCGGPGCEADPLGAAACCESPILDGGNGATCATKQKAPCVRTPSVCTDGLCPDEECAVCCHAGCGTACGSKTCASHPLGADACCATDIYKKNSTNICSAEVPGPCVRVNSCTEFSGQCEDAECAVCCDPGCKVCGGEECSNDPLGSHKCCPKIIAQTAEVCSATENAKVTAACLRLSRCVEFGGLCSDSTCTVCCNRECGKCVNGHECELGHPECCVDTIIAADQGCGEGIVSPCKLAPLSEQGAPPSTGSDDDDDSFPWWLLILFILLLLSCLALLAFLLMRNKNKKQGDEERNQTAFGLEDKAEEMGQTLLTVEHDDESKQQDSKGSEGIEASRENSMNSRAPKSPANLSPPLRGPKARKLSSAKKNGGSSEVNGDADDLI